MKDLLVLSCILLLAPPQAAVSLKCYVGNGSSYTEQTCGSGLDTCFRVQQKQEDRVVRGCMTKKTCDMVATQCKDTGLCEVKCCQTDLCNGSSKRPLPLWHFLLKNWDVIFKK